MRLIFSVRNSELPLEGAFRDIYSHFNELNLQHLGGWFWTLNGCYISPFELLRKRLRQASFRFLL